MSRNEAPEELKESSDDSMRGVKGQDVSCIIFIFLSKSQIILGESPWDVSVTGSLLLAGSKVSKWKLELSQDFIFT